jgi:hypothetical protein
MSAKKAELPTLIVGTRLMDSMVQNANQLALRFFIQPYPPAARPASPSMTSELASGTLAGGGGFTGVFGPPPGIIAKAGEAISEIVKIAATVGRPKRFIPILLDIISSPKVEIAWIAELSKRRAVHFFRGFLRVRGSCVQF